MKLVILAGGLRSTINEEFEGIPKPMVEIGGKPLLWHIMKYYSYYGISEFIICGGYKVNIIKDYFRDYYIYQSDITINLENNTIEIHKKVTENWKVTVVDTGLNNSPGERIKKIKGYLGDEDFIVTYGDCLSDLNVGEFCKHHAEDDGLVTMMLAKPTGRNAIIGQEGEAWVNGCTFLYSNKIWNEVESKGIEGGMYIPFEIEDGKINKYRHSSFWIPVETVRDKIELEHMWEENKALWKIWE